MQTIEHSMRAVVEALDDKIETLEGHKRQIEAEVRAGHFLDENTTALNQINDSLCAAKGARKLMSDSCCHVYICNFHWMPPEPSEPQA